MPKPSEAAKSFLSLNCPSSPSAGTSGQALCLAPSGHKLTSRKTRLKCVHVVHVFKEREEVNCPPNIDPEEEAEPKKLKGKAEDQHF